MEATIIKKKSFIRYFLDFFLNKSTKGVNTPVLNRNNEPLPEFNDETTNPTPPMTEFEIERFRDAYTNLIENNMEFFCPCSRVETSAMIMSVIFGKSQKKIKLYVENMNDILFNDSELFRAFKTYILKDRILEILVGEQLTKKQIAFCFTYLLRNKEEFPFVVFKNASEEFKKEIHPFMRQPANKDKIAVCNLIAIGDNNACMAGIRVGDRLRKSCYFGKRKEWGFFADIFDQHFKTAPPIVF